jgi:hypothetical protein
MSPFIIAAAALAAVAAALWVQFSRRRAHPSDRDRDGA